MHTTTTEAKENGVQGPEGFLYVEDKGSGWPPILFAHSFGGSSAHWKNQMDYFQSKTRVIAFDFRSHGKSGDSAKQLFSAEALATDIAAVVDSLRLNQFILVGHSMGGAAAVSYAALHAEKIAGLILMGTPGKTPREQSRKIIEALESDKYQTVMDQYMDTLLADADPKTKKIVMADMHGITKATSLSVIKSLFDFDPLQILANTTIPVLIVSTTREKSQPNSLSNQMANIPVKVVEGTSHWLQLDKPSTGNDIIEEFFVKIAGNSRK